MEKRCSNCGTSVEETANFCPKCGSSQFVTVPSQNDNNTSHLGEAPFSNPIKNDDPPYIPVTNQPYIPLENKQKHAKKKLKWWQIVLIILGSLLALFIIIGIIGGDDDSPSTGTPSSYISTTPAAEAKLSKTVMIYMVGSDLESVNGAASLDIVEMMNSGVNTGKSNILIYTGGTKEWKISDIPVDQNSVYLLQNGEFSLVKSFDSLDMGKSETLAEFLNYGVTNYSADEYGLILWDHGAGPMIGYGIDELHNDILEMSELNDALSSAGFGGGKKLEFLGFDACLMGSIETAWNVKDYANYLIASQETEPGCGWDYSFLKQLNNFDSGKDIGASIVDSYILGYNTLVKEYPQMEADVTLSCMDLSKINDVEQCLDDLFSKVDNNILAGYFPEVSRCRNNTKAFGKFASTFNYDLIDIGHIVSLLSNDYSTESEKLNKSLKEFICYSKSNVANVTGVSIYHPYDNIEFMDAWVNNFKSLGFANKYAQYIADFGTLLSKGGSSSWKAFGTTKGAAVKKSSSNELSIQLTDEQVENYAGSNYYILKKVKDDQYLFIFSGMDAQLSSNGILSATYNNKAVFAVNDKTKAVSDTPITMYQVRDGGDDLKYYASAIFWYSDDDDISNWKTDPVEWQIKIDGGVPKALGAFLIEGVNGEEIPQKQLLNYQDYTSVEFSFSTRIPKRDSAGNLLPYFEWDSTGDFYGNQYEVSDGFHLECRDIDNKDDYYVMFVVKDVQGNNYSSELFPLSK